MKRRSFISVVCAMLCAVIAFAVVGCGNSDADNDYANFVKMQARYETEKELVKLLREYDAAYTSYTDVLTQAPFLPFSNDASLAFVFEGNTILTDENIKLVTLDYDADSGEYSVTIIFDSIGATILADITSNNIGSTMEIVVIENGYTSIISMPTINSAITDGIAPITGGSANDLYFNIARVTAERSVRKAAVAYNEKCAEYQSDYSMPVFLPAVLAVEPEYIDVSEYLQKADASGFTA